MALTAVQAVQRMRGGAQSQLMLCDDGLLWVVKFQNNPQHVRVLANELLATRIAEVLGLSVPKTEVVEVSPWLVEKSPQLRVQGARGAWESCSAGLQFGSQFVGGLMPGQVVDYLPESQLTEVRNLGEFAGMLLVDKWTGNCNGRQAVFERRVRERRYRAVFIDQGFCFNAGEWTFPDSPLRGVYARNLVYAGVRGWESFEPWVAAIEGFAGEKLWEIAEMVPPEWYGGDVGEIERLVEMLLKRRSRVRELVEAFRVSDREPFPYWGRTSAEVRAGRVVQQSAGPRLLM
ncbi:hypothetical protein SAMN05421819_2149 [Bryocella elongata]|uniref:HipA-like kinase domain-containing protein n=1 Tax=Bryocella elongata TaxID=863522 RepID=A0A1H5Y800_9BACT|nr:HipA family kinase [Bryocella elongata]SEG19626.1 hypothetical protein SAMN05421819_2149 [Bryocella elongata]